MKDMTRKEARLWIYYYTLYQIPCHPERFVQLMKIAGYLEEENPFEPLVDPIDL